MTVAELIAKLQALPQDLPVYLGDPEGYHQDTSIDDDRCLPGSLHPRVAEPSAANTRPYPHDLSDLPRRVVIGG